MSQKLGDIMLLWFCFSSWIFLLVFVLKTQKRRSFAWRVIFVMALGFGTVSTYIFLRRIDVIPNTWAPWFYFITFGLLAGASTAWIFQLLSRNWSLWAWSDTEEVEDDSTSANS